MLRYNFYSFDSGGPASGGIDLLSACQDGDIARWHLWYDRFESAIPPGAKTYTPAPISKSSAHYGSEDLDRNRVPDAESPVVWWTLRDYMILNAPATYEGFEGFNGGFLDGLGLEHRVKSEEARRVYHLYRTRMLMPEQAISGGVSYLHNPDAYCSYLTTTELRDVLEADRAANFLADVTSSLETDEECQEYAEPLRQWNTFLHDVADAGRDLYYYEFAT